MAHKPPIPPRDLLSELSRAEADLIAYKFINVELHVEISRLKKALRKIQGHEDVCPKAKSLAEEALNRRN